MAQPNFTHHKLPRLFWANKPRQPKRTSSSEPVSEQHKVCVMHFFCRLSTCKRWLDLAFALFETDRFCWQPFGFWTWTAKRFPIQASFPQICRLIVHLWATKTLKNGPPRRFCSPRFYSQTVSLGLIGVFAFQEFGRFLFQNVVGQTMLSIRNSAVRDPGCEFDFSQMRVRADLETKSSEYSIQEKT